LSDNKCWAIKPDKDQDGCCSDWFQLFEIPSPQKQLFLDRFVHKLPVGLHIKKCDFVLPDLEEEPPLIESVKKEPKDDFCYDYRSHEEVKQYKATVPQTLQRKRLVSRRYVYLQEFPASHATLKTVPGSENVQDNSNSVYVSVFPIWKNELVNLGRSTYRFPSLVRLLTNDYCAVSDQTLKQCIRKLTSCKKMTDVCALYSTLKALAAFHPRSSPAVNCHILDKLPEKSADETKSVRDILVLDYIVSCAELELLHYPMVRHRDRELSKLLAIDSPLVRRLMHETEQSGCSDVKRLALLQRAVVAVGQSDKWLFIDKLTTKLYRLYRHTRSVQDRHQLLSSVAKPLLRSKLARHILSERCSSFTSTPLKQFLSRDSVCMLCSLLPEWLNASSSSAAVGNTTNQVEEFLSVIVTYLESNLHIHKGWCL